jgi:hypothetical protein
MNVYYAVQICDVANNQISRRYCNTDRTTLSKKSIMSLMESIQYVTQEVSLLKHNILFVDDHSTQSLKSFLKFVKSKFENDLITIEIMETTQHGLMTTVRSCYEWMLSKKSGLVYQIQDDYIFTKTAVMEMIDVFFQMKIETNSEIIVTPYNDNYNLITSYRNRVTPRVIISAKNRYWISVYDLSCSFMTSVGVFNQNWDLMDRFCNMPSIGDENGNLENVTINKMIVDRGRLALAPINSLALHIQSDLDKDPYIDWKSWWDQIDIDI